MCSPNLKFPNLIFFNMMTSENDYPWYEKHVSDSICVFFTLFGGWLRGPWGGGGFPKELVHNVLMQIFILGSSKIEVSETIFLT